MEHIPIEDRLLHDAELGEIAARASTVLAAPDNCELARSLAEDVQLLLIHQGALCELGLAGV